MYSYANFLKVRASDLHRPLSRQANTQTYKDVIFLSFVFHLSLIFHEMRMNGVEPRRRVIRAYDRPNRRYRARHFKESSNLRTSRV